MIRYQLPTKYLERFPCGQSHPCIFLVALILEDLSQESSMIHAH